MRNLLTTLSKSTKKKQVSKLSGGGRQSSLKIYNNKLTLTHTSQSDFIVPGWSSKATYTKLSLNWAWIGSALDA